MENKIHKFEEAGLGKAPFRVVGGGQIPKDRDNNPRGVGSCHYCGACIRQVFVIESADGKQFKVGSTCVEKTGDKGMIDVVKRKVNEIKRQQRYDREAKKRAEAKIEIDQILADEKIVEKLNNEPHPNDYYASQGKTFLDYIQWNLQNAGHRGYMWAHKTLKKYKGD